MQTKIIFRTVIILMILSSTIVCDQISKNIVRGNLAYNEEKRFLHNFVTLTKVENHGAFLSLGDTLPKLMSTVFLTIIPLLILIAGFIFLMVKNSLSNISVFGISLVIGGGIGNIYDRILYGSVTDFLHINFVIFQTGIFNMADVSIMAGMFLLLYEAYFKKAGSNSLV